MAKPTLTNQSFWKKTSESLRFIIKDAGEAARAMRNHDTAAEAKYLEQVDDACTVLHFRSRETDKFIVSAMTQGRL